MNCLRNLVVIGGIAAAAAMIATGFAAVAPAVTAQTEPEIIVRGGEVFTEGSLRVADVRIVGETIAEIGTGLAARDAGTQEIDAGGLLVLPGGIDPHVHLGGNRVDDYTSGSAAALAGGITTISNFGGVAGGETPAETLARAMPDIRAQAIADVIFHPIVSDPASATVDSLGALAEAGQTTIKVLAVHRPAAAAASAALPLRLSGAVASQLLPYRRPPAGSHPPNDVPAYRSTALRHPAQPLVVIPQTLSELTGPVYGYGPIGPLDDDLTRQHPGAPLGERIVIAGRVLDEDARPVPETLVEVWQANAAGRYAHALDTHDAPLDPNFSGAGRVLTDADGRFRFTTIRPGAYPWGNHDNAWRPAHVHFSVFGRSFLTRLVTQMYFPGDPLLALDPIYNAVPTARGRERLVAAFDLEVTEPGRALGYRFDIVLRGRDATPREE